MYFHKVFIQFLCILFVIEISTGLPVPNDNNEGSKERTEKDAKDETATDSNKELAPSIPTESVPQTTENNNDANTKSKQDQPEGSNMSDSVGEQSGPSVKQDSVQIENVKAKEVPEDQETKHDNMHKIEPLVKNTTPNKLIVNSQQPNSENRQNTGNRASGMARLQTGESLTSTANSRQALGRGGVVSVKSGSKQTNYATDEDAVTEQLEPFLSMIQNGMDSTSAQRQLQQSKLSQLASIDQLISRINSNGARNSEMDLLLKISRQQNEFKQMLTQMSIRQSNIEDAVYNVAKNLPGSEY